MTDNDKNNIPVIYVHEEDEEDFEREEQRVNALLRKPKKKRTQPLKDLMRNRTELEQGLTMFQMFCEVFPDIVDARGPTGPQGESATKLPSPFSIAVRKANISLLCL
jgi:hypothetical protein